MPEDAPEGLYLAGLEVEEGFHRGMKVYGIPMGSNEYVRQVLDRKVESLVFDAKRCIGLLAGN